MMDEDAFAQLVAEIESQGYDQATAARYAALIGDTPIRGQDGNLVVMDGPRAVDRIPWPRFFEESQDAV